MALCRVMLVFCEGVKAEGRGWEMLSSELDVLVGVRSEIVLAVLVLALVSVAICRAKMARAAAKRIKMGMWEWHFDALNCVLFLGAGENLNSICKLVD